MPSPEDDEDYKLVDGIRIASALSIYICPEHGSVYVRLHDEKNEIFAASIVEASVVHPFLAQAVERIADYLKSDNIGKPQGSA
jgi:hypothetical protein